MCRRQGRVGVNLHSRSKAAIWCRACVFGGSGWPIRRGWIGFPDPPRVISEKIVTAGTGAWRRRRRGETPGQGLAGEFDDVSEKVENCRLLELVEKRIRSGRCTVGPRIIISDVLVGSVVLVTTVVVVVGLYLRLREAERRGKAAANTGPSTSNEGRVNSGAEETNEPAGGSGSLQ
ncbi:hypothetical protein T4D_2135 [Trichinella pseudospiralis]|uniref:Uncharacterized protein n=1 Tax=Trichinella pseudospiralis TaxID=6337 RepID=A0A0V1FKG7_TRIPS|nr:hypothetical protein T4D_2135 [Trichinella pseudospiralis]